MPFFCRALCLLLLVGVARGAVAQPQPAPGALRAEARARLVGPGDSLFVLHSVRRAGGRVDDRTGIVRADYRIAARLAQPPPDPVAAARAFLMQNAARYGLRPDLADLRVARVVSGRYSHHVAFAQTVGGLPVWGREIQVNLDRERQPLLVTNAYDPALGGTALGARQVDAPAARAIVAAQLDAPEGVETVEETVVPLAPVRRAWRVAARAGGVEWEFLVDGETGAVRAVVERSTHGLTGAGRTAAPGAMPAAAPFGAAPQVLAGPRATAMVDGMGLVFDPDPLSTAGAAYGAPGFVDGTRRDSGGEIIEESTPQLDAQRQLVVLPDLTFSGGLYTLDGPYVRIVGDAPPGGRAYAPPTATRPDGFGFTRAQDGFEAVMAYYHADRAQRRVQALDVGRPVNAQPQRINPRGFTADDSRFYPTSGLIAFGLGGIDDAEDADVVWHEYAHALLHSSQPALYQATDGTALHEGWSDYWAASYSRGQMERGEAAGDWRQLFQWDGNNGCWQGRRLDHPGHYPDSQAYPPLPGCNALPTIYQRGLLWATTLMEIYDRLGQDVTDRLNVASHAFLGGVTAAPAFEVAAEALVAADEALYGGQYRGVLLGVLGARGYLDPAAFGPVVAHTPLISTEQMGGTRPIAVEVTSAAAVASVVVRYRVAGGAEATLALESADGVHFTGDFPIPDRPAEVAYFVEARDSEGRTTRQPSAPGETFRFTAGPDAEPPQIVHTARTSLPLAAWPPEIAARVTDNLGVDSVWVVYAVFGSDGAPGAAGRFALAPDSGDAYRARWPLAAAALSVGSRVRYHVEARDIAARPNTARLPAADAFEIEIVARGRLAFFDAEGEAAGVGAGGAWQQGAPRYGLQAAHTGDGVWMTGLERAYPAERSASFLTLPALDLRGDPPFLVFWHWYDTEHAPGYAPLFDGGRVEVSTDGGASWRVAAPLGGYPDSLATGAGEGSGAWGRFSFGWQRATVPLPARAGVRVRLAFYTDAGNVEPTRYGFAGWAVDDIAVTTLLSDDTLPPFAEALPPAVAVEPAGLAPPPFFFDARDETGVVRAEVRLTRRAGGATVRDTLRLEQMPGSQTRFTGALGGTTAPGDDLAYTLYLEDADGNGITYPEGGAFTVQFRTLQQRDVLAGARDVEGWARAGGVWKAQSRAAGTRATLVLAPLDLPRNAEALRLHLEHHFNLPAGAGGNVKASTDGGRTWQVLVPEGGYPALFESPGHTMDGEGVFSGPLDTLASRFDLSGFAGGPLRLRLDLGSARDLGDGAFWAVEAAVQYAASADSAFEVPLAFALSGAQPNPFRDEAFITYTLAEASPVELAVYDVLGRRVALVVDADMLPAGTYTARLAGADLAGGVYLVHLTAGARHQTRQVVHLR